MLTCSESLISQISPRKWIFQQKHFSLFIRGPDGFDSLNKKWQKFSCHCPFKLYQEKDTYEGAFVLNSPCTYYPFPSSHHILWAEPVHLSHSFKQPHSLLLTPFIIPTNLFIKSLTSFLILYNPFINLFHLLFIGHYSFHHHLQTININLLTYIYP